MPNLDIAELDRRAVRAGVDLVSRVTAADLGRATPCSGWNLGELLAHMTEQHLGFAAAAAGRGADPEVWRLPAPASDPVAAYAQAADAVIAAFAADGVTGREFAIPAISTTMTFPGRRAISFHLVDYVVHGWDVARPLGLAPEFDDEVLAIALKAAQAVPGGQARLQPGAAFAPALDASAGAGTLDQILTLLGRSPSWPE
ncbi:MAG TPA: TIGR03086 family metal-binding protein [Streptosporangiaceae bacterium]